MANTENQTHTHTSYIDSVNFTLTCTPRFTNCIKARIVEHLLLLLLFYTEKDVHSRTNYNNILTLHNLGKLNRKTAAVLRGLFKVFLRMLKGHFFFYFFLFLNIKWKMLSRIPHIYFGVYTFFFISRFSCLHIQTSPVARIHFNMPQSNIHTAGIIKESIEHHTLISKGTKN